MCEPATIAASVAIASLALSAGATYANYEAQTEQANSMNAYQNALRAQNIENSKAAYLADNELLNRRLEQERAAAAEEKLKSTIEGEKISAKATTAAGESNVAGLSVDRLLSGIERDVAFNQGTIKRNLVNTEAQAEANRELLKSSFQSNANSVSQGMYMGPSGLATGLAIGGQVLGAVSSNSAIKDKFFSKSGTNSTPTGGGSTSRVTK